MTKIAIFVGCGNKNAHERYRANYEMAVAFLKNKSLFLSQSKICKQKLSGLRLHTMANST